MSPRDELTAKRAEILRLAREHGARDVRLFRSALYGEVRPDSDVDFLVAVGPKTSSWFPAGLVIDLERLMGRKVDVVTESMLHWSIRDEILREAKPL